MIDGWITQGQGAALAGIEACPSRIVGSAATLNDIFVDAEQHKRPRVMCKIVLKGLPVCQYY